MYTVYKHLSPTNKVYIGITSMKPEYRWNNGKGYPSGYFHNAIQKYGWDNFSHEIIATDLTKEEACAMEIQLIKQYNSTDSRFGYNVAPGGDSGCFGYHHTEEAKQRIGEASHNQIRKKGYKLSESHRQAVSIGLKGRKHSAEHNEKVRQALRGRTLSDEFRKKLSESHRGYIMPQSQKDKIGQKSKEFWSNISDEKRAEIVNKSKQNRSTNIGITLYDNEGNIVNTFLTCADCARYLEVSPALVCKRLKKEPAIINNFTLVRTFQNKR